MITHPPYRAALRCALRSAIAAAVFAATLGPAGAVAASTPMVCASPRPAGQSAPVREGHVLPAAARPASRILGHDDPVFKQLAKLTAADGDSGSYLGGTVAISGDTAVVGAPGATVGGHLKAGAVYVFTRPAGGWADATQTAKLTISGAPGLAFLGSSVAIDRGTIVAGASGTGAAPGGAVYVFTRPGGGWTDETQTAVLTAADPVSGDELGFSVTIAGGTIVAGAPSKTICGNSYQGAAYVFTEPSGGWASETQAAELTDFRSSSLGTSVAASRNTVVVGGSGTSVGDTINQGAVFAFTEPTGGWANEHHAAMLTASDAATNQQLGLSVAMSGTTVVAGAPNSTVGPYFEQGAAYVFTEPPGGWADETQTAKLTASGGTAFESTGIAVAIDAGTIVAGALGPNDYQGALYVFSKRPGGWADETQTAELAAADGAAGDNLGVSVAISGDTIVGGAPFAAIGASPAQGAVYLFGPPTPPPPTTLRLSGFLSPGRGSHWRAGSAVPVRARVEYPDGSPIPAWLAGELSGGCELTARTSGAQPTQARCLRWNPAKNWFYWIWHTHTRPTGTVTLTVNLYYHSHDSHTERLALTPANRRP